MDSEELLAQLADIHLPDPVSFWPPAPGWWLLALLLLIVMALALRAWQKRQHLTRLKRAALAELDAAYAFLADSADPGSPRYQLSYVNSVNTIMRRVALQREHSIGMSQAGLAASSLSGSAWIDYLRQHGDASLLDEELAQLLRAGRFQEQCKVEPDKLDEMARKWISSLYATAPGKAAAANAEPRNLEASA